MKSFYKELWLLLKREWTLLILLMMLRWQSMRGIKEGLCLVNAMHITASVFINDDESGLHRDYKLWLEKLAPHEPLTRYDHNLTR